MSWVQLLAVSKSIDSVPDRPSPYKMTQQKLLPKFGTERSERVETECVEQRSEEKIDPDVGLFRGSRVVVTGGRVSPPAPVSELAEPEIEKPVERPVRSRLRQRWSLWKRRTRHGMKRESAEPVQAELALDMVRVVRNDLMDDDLTVVSMRPTEAKSGWKKWFRWFGGRAE
jgi:hypothetical protein